MVFYSGCFGKKYDRPISTCTRSKIWMLKSKTKKSVFKQAASVWGGIPDRFWEDELVTVLGKDDHEKKYGREG
jgi:hypothetical protein